MEKLTDMERGLRAELRAAESRVAAIAAAFAKREEGYKKRRHGGVVNSEVLDEIGRLLAATPVVTASGPVVTACPSCGWVEGHDEGCGDTGRPRLVIGTATGDGGVNWDPRLPAAASGPPTCKAVTGERVCGEPLILMCPRCSAIPDEPVTASGPGEARHVLMDTRAVACADCGKTGATPCAVCDKPLCDGCAEDDKHYQPARPAVDVDAMQEAWEAVLAVRVEGDEARNRVVMDCAAAITRLAKFDPSRAARPAVDVEGIAATWLDKLEDGTCSGYKAILGAIQAALTAGKAEP